MNWKINYWTAITAIMAGCLIYSCMDTEGGKQAKWKQQINQIDQNVEEVLGLLESKAECDDKPDTISASVALGRMIPFIGKMQAIEREVDATEKTEGQKIQFPVNMGFVGLKMPKCETLKIFEKAPDGNAYIILTLEQNPHDTSEQVISAIISDRTIIDKNGKLDKELVAGASLFDFIRPCPPLCGDGIEKK